MEVHRGGGRLNSTGERLVDAAGNRHERAARGARIVSLVPSITELLFDLGLGASLVGRTHYCVHPAPQVAAVPSLGGTKKVKLERLRALDPSHVIVNVDENTRETVDAIARFVPGIVVTHPLAPRDNLALYRLIGGIFGRSEAAEALCARFEAALGSLLAGARALPSRRVLYLIWKDPWMTVSRDTYVSGMLALVDWHTLGHDPARRYPAIEITPSLLAETDIVLFSSEPFAFDRGHVEAFRAAHACGTARLERIDGEMTSWYGSRAICGLEYLGALAARLALRRRRRAPPPSSWR